jgi:dTDP-4-amino-4,6-dideoxy-D-galactose acyltransferase
MASELFRILEWDAEFFGVRIARVNEDRLRAADVPQLQRDRAAEGIDCLYLLSSAADSATHWAAQDAGFRLVDIRVTLERRELAAGTVAPLVRPAAPADVPALREIARASHYDSRFYADPHFSREACGRLYETWIERSCAGWAQAVLVVEAEGSPAGYLTCHVSGAEGSIGLVAIRESSRGRGFGGQLMSAALSYFARAGTSRVEVVTQGRNLASQRLYQRFGFCPSAVQLWYHYWSA